MSFSENLRRYREKSGLSRKDIAEKIHMTANGYGLYETGRSEPKLEVLNKIADVLGVSTDDLLGRGNVTTFFRNLGFWIRPNELLGKDFVAFIDMESDSDEVYPAPKEALLPIMEQLKKDSREQQRKETLDALQSFKEALEQSAANLMNQQLKNDFGIDMDKLFKMIQDTPPQLLQHLDENTWIKDLIKLHTEQPTPAQHQNDTPIRLDPERKYHATPPLATIRLDPKRKHDADATPPAQDHDDADDKKAKEKGPHSNE